jgi:hypothetical protein
MLTVMWLGARYTHRVHDDHVQTSVSPRNMIRPKRREYMGKCQGVSDRTRPGYIFFLGGEAKGGNASCTVASCGAVCGTPSGLPLGLSTRWTTMPPDLPTKTPSYKFRTQHQQGGPYPEQLLCTSLTVSVQYGFTSKLGVTESLVYPPRARISESELSPERARVATRSHFYLSLLPWCTGLAFNILLTLSKPLPHPSGR